MEKSIANKSFSEVAKYFCEIVDIKFNDTKGYSSLTLALIGDAIYDMLIRTYVIGQGDDRVNNLHGKKSYYVRAKSQAEFIDYFKDNLSEIEMDVYRRARNKKSNTSAKNATIVDYRKSTGFEALLGYLYLEKNFERIAYIVKEAINFANKNYIDNKR